MHIDHNQLKELLTETSGIDGEKIDQQIAELIKEIKQAVSDGEAYEIEGFGIFSGIGNRLLFIPSKELETEINFKYVGMEPIELEVDQVQKEEDDEKEDPFADLQELEKESKRDPFAGLIEDFEDEVPANEDDGNIIFGVEAKKKLYNDEDEPEEIAPGPDEWGIDAHKEEGDSASKLLSSLLGAEHAAEENEEESEPVDDTSFDDIFGDDIEGEKEEETVVEESVGNLDAELSELMSGDSEDISTEEIAAGLIDEDLSDVFGEAEDEEAPEIDTNFIDDLIEEETTEEEAESVEAVAAEPEVEETEGPETEGTAVIDSEPEEIDLDDFDDPFLDLEEEIEEEEQEPAEEIVPVITNISSGIESKPKEEPKPEEEKKVKPKKKKEAPKPAPVWLYIVMALVIIMGTTFGLGYFSIVTIPGITPQSANTNTAVVTPPPTIVDEPIAEEEPVNTSTDETTETQTPPVQEQVEVAQVPVSVSSEQVPTNQDTYGMMGVANTAANDGYTIVLFSLSIQQSAMAKQQELSNNGYRVLVTPIASEQYGTLWRVSIGQFPTLASAAIASEEMDAKFRENYFIKKITN